MSIYLSEKKARLTVFGHGWNNEVVDSGDGGTEDGSVIKDISESLGYDFGDVDWDAIADQIGIDINDGYYVDEDYFPYGYYEGFDGDFYYDYDGDGIYTDEYGIEYDGNGEYIASEVLQEKLSQELAQLANDEEALYECMTDHGDSECIPARIIVTNPPDKVEYEEGENIDFTGIVVCAYSSATARTPFIRQEWSGPRHNQVPFKELTFPVTTAKSFTIGAKIKQYGVVTLGPFDGILEIGSQKAGIYTYSFGAERYWEIEVDEDSIGVFFTRSTSGFGFICASRTNGAIVSREYSTAVENGERVLVDKFYASSKSTYYGKAAYYSYVQIGFSGGYKLEGDFLDVKTSISDNQSSRKITSGHIAWLLLYGEKTVPIPVQWQTDYQTEPYEDSFDITVT